MNTLSRSIVAIVELLSDLSREETTAGVDDIAEGLTKMVGRAINEKKSELSDD